MIRTNLMTAVAVLTLACTQQARSSEFTVESAKKAVNRYLGELADIDRVAAERKAAAKARLDRALREMERFETKSRTGKTVHWHAGIVLRPQGAHSVHHAERTEREECSE